MIEKEKMLEAYLIDRIAQIIRDIDISFGAGSFILAESYMPEIMEYLRRYLREDSITEDGK